MSELRAPDPTLDALGEPVGVEYWSPDPGVAHRLPDGPGGSMSACGYRGLDAMPSLYAAYVAVPCRECFPDAPPPGHSLCSPDTCGGARGEHMDPDLTWQEHL